MGKTRDHFKKIRDTKGTFHAKMGAIKDRNCMDLTEAEDIKRWQEYTEELNKKDLHNPDNHDGVKILQVRLQQYMNRELPDVQAGFRKGRGTKLPTSAGSSKKQESSRKTSISASLTMPKPLTVWIIINCGKF